VEFRVYILRKNEKQRNRGSNQNQAENKIVHFNRHHRCFHSGFRKKIADTFGEKGYGSLRSPKCPIW
jgi:hypothetical protein